jgi:hypothetical protein
MRRPRDTNLRRKAILSFVEVGRKKPISGGGGQKEAEKETNGHKRNPLGCRLQTLRASSLTRYSAVRLHDLASGTSISKQREFQIEARKLNNSRPFATNLPCSKDCFYLPVSGN